MNAAHLANLRAHCDNNDYPWSVLLPKLKSSGVSSASYTPHPVPIIKAGNSGNSAYQEANNLPDVGADEHMDDARAAYTQAVLWAVTGETRYATKSAQILDAWMNTCTEILFDTPVRTDNGQRLYANGKLQAAWGASLFARAAEIIRHTSTAWTEAKARQFGEYLDRVYLPLTITGWYTGANWLMSFAEATMYIGIYNDNVTTYNAGVAYWRAKTPTCIYLSSADGPKPISPASYVDTDAELRSLWRNPSSYIDGLEQETGRDMQHTAMGFGAMANAAETAWIQGTDLFAEEQTRIVTGLELNTYFLHAYEDEIVRRGVSSLTGYRPPGWVNSDALKVLSTRGHRQGWPVANLHYTRILGVSLPNTTAYVERFINDDFWLIHNSWEFFTHGRY